MFLSIFASGLYPRVLHFLRTALTWLFLWWYIDICAVTAIITVMFCWGGGQAKQYGWMMNWFCIFIWPAVGAFSQLGAGGGCGALQLSEFKRNTTVGAKSLPHSSHYKLLSFSDTDKNTACLSLTKHISACLTSQPCFSFPPPQGKPSCQRAEDPHVGVREVIEQEGKQETVSQRRGSHTALAMNRLEETCMGISYSVLHEQEHYRSWVLLAI